MQKCLPRHRTPKLGWILENFVAKYPLHSSDASKYSESERITAEYKEFPSRAQLCAKAAKMFVPVKNRV